MTTSTPPMECTANSHNSGHFFDLRPLTKHYPKDSSDYFLIDDFPSHDPTHPIPPSSHANYTLNICAPLLLPNNSPTTSIIKHLPDGSSFSLGSVSTDLAVRGKNIVLEYKNGDLCPGTNVNATSLIAFRCSRSDTSTGTTVSFVGSPDGCAHFFEVRSIHACPAMDRQQSIAPGWIFFVILGIAVCVVYLVTPRIGGSGKRSKMWGRTHDYYRNGGKVYKEEKDTVSNLVVVENEVLAENSV